MMKEGKGSMKDKSGKGGGFGEFDWESMMQGSYIPLFGLIFLTLLLRLT
jgi:hypothetical protein